MKETIVRATKGKRKGQQGHLLGATKSAKEVWVQWDDGKTTRTRIGHLEILS